MADEFNIEEVRTIIFKLIDSLNGDWDYNAVKLRGSNKLISKQNLKLMMDTVLDQLIELTRITGAVTTLKDGRLITDLDIAQPLDIQKKGVDKFLDNN